MPTMHDLSAIPIQELLPHRGAMCLLQRALQADSEQLIAEVVIKPGGLFCANNEVAAWVGIEYMAQAIAAWAGWQARQRGEAPKVGLLVGTRRYESAKSSFALGPLTVSVKREFQADNGLGQFDCMIQDELAVVARASITVFEPPDAEAFFRELNAKAEN
jgi:predicted hotdog family 3-hydroxylacyl-ACP dehydratase